MRGLFIASTGQHIGKTTACLGLFSGLHKIFSSLGYMKPIGQQHITTKQGIQVDKDVLVFKKHFALTDSLESMSPILIPAGFTRDFLDKKIHIDDLRKKMISSFKTIQENKQLVLVEGTGHCGVGSIIHLNNAQVAKELNLPLILISSGGLGSSFDDLMLNITLCNQYKLSILGVILNRVLPEKQEMIQHYMRKALKRWDLPLLGCIPFDPFLSTFSMGDFELLFQTSIITGSNYRFRHFDRIRLVATSVESYREMILPNQLIITPSNREDIILATLNKHLELLDTHKEGLCAGMILTGDFTPRHYLIEQLAKADIPVLYTPLHSYTAMQKISAFTAKISTEDLDKIEEAISIAESHIDFSLLQSALNGS
ncbi:MAG: AAA family ATPase [Candidatus Rhabdochlamydia sp.]